MRITELLDVKSICLDAKPASKKEALDQAIDLMVKSGKINDVEAYKLSVYEREEEGTTGVGDGIAIPHGRGESVSKPGLAAMVVKNGVDFDALDEAPVLHRIGNSVIQADARILLKDLEKLIGPFMTKKEKEEFVDSVGGLVFHLAGRLPRVGEKIEHSSGVVFQVLDVDARHVKKFKITKFNKLKQEKVKRSFLKRGKKKRG